MSHPTTPTEAWSTIFASLARYSPGHDGNAILASEDQDLTWACLFVIGLNLVEHCEMSLDEAQRLCTDERLVIRIRADQEEVAITADWGDGRALVLGGIDVTTTEQPVETSTLRDLIDTWAVNVPNFHLTAGEHPFACSCNSCLTFLAKTGLDYITPPDPEWTALQRETLGPDGRPTPDQARRFAALADRHL